MFNSKKFSCNTGYLKKPTQLFQIVVFIISLFWMIGCHDEPCHEELWTNQEVNEVIYKTMKEEYLWYDEIPLRKGLHFEADPEDFFYSLLVGKDGKNDSPYSRILPEGENFLGNSFIGFGLYYHPQLLIATFIVPNGPAQRAGIQRGDRIKAINGTQVNMDNIQQILSASDKETLFTINRLEEEGKPEQTLDIKIPGRQMIQDSPLYLDTIYSETNIGKVGYLFFHEEFTLGPDGDTLLYTNQLKQIFAHFYDQEVKYMILDLRDNRGGDLSMCQLMCTMLAPQDAIGKLFMTHKFNALKENQDLLFDQQLIGTGARLDLQKLVVIVSSTTASASELVIHCLKPYLRDKLIVVGTKTYGKNVGMSFINGLEIPWILVPVTFYCVNAEGNSNYSDGLQPDIYREEDYSRKFYPYGDCREQLLNAALKAIGAINEE